MINVHPSLNYDEEDEKFIILGKVFEIKEKKKSKPYWVEWAIKIEICV